MTSMRIAQILQSSVGKSSARFYREIENPTLHNSYTKQDKDSLAIASQAMNTQTHKHTSTLKLRCIVHFTASSEVTCLAVTR